MHKVAVHVSGSVVLFHRYIYLLAKYKVYIVRIRAFYLSLIVSAVVMYVYCSCF